MINTWLDKLPQNPFTVSGRMLAVATGAGLLAILDSSLAVLLSHLVWLILVSFVAGLAFRPQLRCRLSREVMIANGETETVQVLVKNVGRRAAYDLEFIFCGSNDGIVLDRSPQSLAVIDPGGEVQLTFTIHATARGEHALPKLHIASLFPFGLFRFSRLHAVPGNVIVTPAYQIDRANPRWTREASRQLAQLVSNRQRSLEYLGSREYRVGLPVRRWDFSAWARLGIPTIREFNETNEPSAIVVVDAYSRSTSKTDPVLETLLSKAATASASLVQAGIRIQLIVIEQQSIVLEGAEGHSPLNPLDVCLRQLARVKGLHTTQDVWQSALQSITLTTPPDWMAFYFLRSDHVDSIASLPLWDIVPPDCVDWTPTPTDAGRSSKQYSGVAR